MNTLRRNWLFLVLMLPLGLVCAVLLVLLIAVSVMTASGAWKAVPILAGGLTVAWFVRSFLNDVRKALR